MIKKLLFLFTFIPLITFAQFSDDFEDGDISNWTQSVVGHWAATITNPISGAYSVQQVFNSTSDSRDQISIALPIMDLNAQTVVWHFRVKHGYDPSSSNNWGVFLASSSNAEGMFSGGTANGYVLGVNYSGSDDSLRLWKVTNGVGTKVLTTSINWQTQVGIALAPAIEVVKNKDGLWQISVDINGSFGSLILVGEGTDNSYSYSDYLGIYYKYSSTQDLKLWFDELSVETYDTISPLITNLNVKSSGNIEIAFNEKMDSVSMLNTLNYFVDGSIGTPDSVSLNPSDFKTVNLFFNEKLNNQQEYQIQVQNCEDLKGNSIIDTILNFTYEYIMPLSVEITSSNQLTVTFSRETDTPSAENPMNYFLNNGSGNPQTAAVTIDDSSKVLLEFSSNFINSTYYNLSIQDVADRNLDTMLNVDLPFLYFVPQPDDVVINEIMADPTPEVNLPNIEYIEIVNTTSFDIDLTGWKIKIGATEKTLTSYVLDSSSYLILCNSSAVAELSPYGNVLGISSLPTITNSGATISVFNNLGILFSTVSFTTDWYNDNSKIDGGWSIEQIDPQNNCSGLTNWNASVNANGGTPGIINSVYSSNIDSLPPQLEKIEVISANQVRIYFNEQVDSSTALIITNFEINNGIGFPDSISINNNLTQVDLFFTNSFVDKQYYFLTIINVSDNCGNVIPDGDIQFLYYLVQPNDVVINEIMADPFPEVMLPNYEYIEIFNTTIYPIVLKDWKLKIGSAEVLFPSYNIEPETYLILCSELAEIDLAYYGNTLSFSSFPSISNSGTSIALTDKGNVIISNTNFTTDWYNDNSKIDGGWSIERIDPQNNCSGITNWQASENANGGTPGIINSVYSSNIDSLPPQLEKIEVISVNQVRIYFNEQVDSSTALIITNFEINNGIGFPDSISLNSNLIQMDLFFTNSFVDKQYYSLTVFDVSDNCGNVIIVTDNQFLYYLVQPNDVVINEIMADPFPEVMLPNYEYIEIFNTTIYPIDLKDWKLKIGSTEVLFPSYNIEPETYLILCSELAEIDLAYYGNTLSFSSFPSISNSGTSIALTDKSNVIISNTNFTTDWYNDNSKIDGGWSIERIDPQNNCSGMINWQASIDTDGGTPGSENSVFASYTDSLAPEVQSVEVISSNQLRLIFSEQVDSVIALNELNYEVNLAVGNPFSAILNANGKQVDLLFANSFIENSNHTLTINNITDWCGNIIQLFEIDFAYYLVQPYDILINEIMADPDSTVNDLVYEYIEIFNTTGFNISLSEWTITAGTTARVLPSYIIEPQEYLILCNDKAYTLLKDYGNTLIVSGFPALTNSGQTLTLSSKEGSVISTVSYTDKWYNDVFKAEGGWSLEQIDIDNPCGGENNWTASTNISGGTPGQQNSVFGSNPDLMAPELLHITVIDQNKVRLYFNEPYDSISAMQLSNYIVDNNTGVPGSITLESPEYLTLILNFNDSFSENTIYNLEISGGISDCSGNEIGNKNSARFAIPVIPEFNDLVINEILFNPLSGGYDFIEIYNRSQKTFDLKDLRIAAYDDLIGDYSSIKTISDNGFLVFPSDYVVLTENTSVVQQHYYTANPYAFIQLSSMPSFNDDAGRAILMDNLENTIDNMEYYNDMHFALLATTDGVSLERLNFDRPTDDKTNWHSASELVGFATPAYENSQYKEIAESEDHISISPEVFSPDNDGFEDMVDIQFTFDNPGYVAHIKIYDSRGRLIRYLANNKLLGTDGVISWDGLTDNNQKTTKGIYIIYIEIFDLKGNVKEYRKPIVVAEKY